MNRPDLAFIEDLARQAGAILRAGFGGSQHMDYKGAIDPVTEMDRRSEALILEQLSARFPSHRLVAEESGSSAGNAHQSWFIDPLDGTVNYAHGVPYYCVSLAYAEAGQVQMGVVFAPEFDECYSAVRGQGAWLNGRPIHPSAAKALNTSLLITGFPYDIRTNPATNLDNHNRLSMRTHGVRRLGSAAMDLCYVAAGRVEGFWELRLKPWDMAAGSLIAEQAGAQVTRIDGQPYGLDGPESLIAATPGVYAELLAALNPEAA